MHIFRRRLRAAAADEQGVAIVTVLLIIVVSSGLMATTLTWAGRDSRSSRRTQDWEAALAAAEAGVDDYLTRINVNDSYSQWDSTTRPDTANAAMIRTSQPLPPFVSIPGGSGAFRYRVDSTATYGTTGVISVTSTGQVNGVQRTVKADVKRRGFTDYLYFTDRETIDPDLYSTTLRNYLINNRGSADYCAGQLWAYSSAQRSFCVDTVRDSRTFNPATSWTPSEYRTTIRNSIGIRFAGTDVINGALHSNDAIRMDPTTTGPRFLGNVTTSFPTAPRWLQSDGSVPSSGTSPRPQFVRTGDPAYVPVQGLPTTNDALRVDAINGGCLFTGPTSITLRSDGRMTVLSPFSRDTNPGRSTKCYSGSGITSALTMNLPANGVVYVQNVPATSSDPNHRTSCGYSSPAHPLGYPRTGETTTYGCLDGDLFIEGTLRGQLTAAASNDVIITWDLLYDGGLDGSDLLGLVATNNVAVYHPVNSSGVNINHRPSGCGSRCRFIDPVINAAILTLQHSFTVQNFRSGDPLGTLTVNGSISQKYRGPVGTGSTTTLASGYAKDYNYDGRLRNVSPPRFLQPTDSRFDVSRWEERPNA
jgi:hypothetical protein